MTGPRPGGKLIVIAAPSGAGKTTLVHALIERNPEFVFSVSYTTRPKRPNEEHGRDYFFVSEEEFRRLDRAGEFLESARVFDNYYGTSRSQVESELAQGRNVVLEIDWQGARQVRAAMPECRSIFILPPSVEALEQRPEQETRAPAAPSLLVQEALPADPHGELEQPLGQTAFFVDLRGHAPVDPFEDPRDGHECGRFDGDQVLAQLADRAGVGDARAGHDAQVVTCGALERV